MEARGGWVCMHCLFENSTKGTECKLCGLERETNKARRSGKKSATLEDGKQELDLLVREMEQLNNKINERRTYVLSHVSRWKCTAIACRDLFVVAITVVSL